MKKGKRVFKSANKIHDTQLSFFIANGGVTKICKQKKFKHQFITANKKPTSPISFFFFWFIVKTLLSKEIGLNVNVLY